MSDWPAKPTQVRYSTIDLLKRLHLELTPYEDSTWEVVNGDDKRVYLSETWFVIYNHEELER